MKPAHLAPGREEEASCSEQHLCPDAVYEPQEEARQERQTRGYEPRASAPVDRKNKRSERKGASRHLDGRDVGWCSGGLLGRTALGGYWWFGRKKLRTTNRGSFTSPAPAHLLQDTGFRIRTKPYGRTLLLFRRSSMSPAGSARPPCVPLSYSFPAGAA